MQKQSKFVTDEANISQCRVAQLQAHYGNAISNATYSPQQLAKRKKIVNSKNVKSLLG